MPFERADPRRDAGGFSYKSLQVLKDLHVYRKTCHALDKVRKDLNGAVRSLGNGFFPIPPCRARLPGFAFFEIRRSQTTDIGVLRNRDAGGLSYKGLQVLKALHVYRKTCHALDKVRKDLNGGE